MIGPRGELPRALHALRRGGPAGLLRAFRRRRQRRRLEGLDADQVYAIWLARNEGRGSATRGRAARPGPPRSVRLVRWDDPGPEEAAARRRPLEEDEIGLVALGSADRLTPGASEILAGALDPDPAVAHRSVVYADEDRLGPDGGRTAPYLKPAWSPILSLTRPGLFPGAPALIGRALWNEILREDEVPADWVDALLRALERAVEIVHVPVPLLSRASAGPGADGLLGSEETRLAAARRAAARRGMPIEIEPAGDGRTARLVPLEADPPARVGVLLPTRDRPDLLRPILAALQNERARGPVEIRVLDHATTDSEALRRLEALRGEPGFSVRRFDGPFNFSRMMNAGADPEFAEHLLFLNNDLEAVEPGWIRRLSGLMRIPGVDVVGARLDYPDGILQHVGIGLGLGTVSAHPFRGSPPRGPFPLVTSPAATREVSAVTGACLMIRRDAFEAVGRFDEDRLPVSFNDVDLCLRVARAGGTILYDAGTRLVHHETATRGSDLDPREVRTMVERWGESLLVDPFLHPALFRGSDLPRLQIFRDGDRTPRRTRLGPAT